MPVERQREYETIYIVRPDATDETLAAVRERVEKVIENYGGHLLKFDDWGSRRLAYEIRDSSEGKRFERGTYQFYRYLVPPGSTEEFERQLRLADAVLKYLTVKVADNLIPEERLAVPEEEEPEFVPPSEHEFDDDDDDDDDDYDDED